MGKNKQKNHKPDEYLLGKLRELKKEIRRKDQRIRQLERDLMLKSPIKEKKSRKEEPKCESCGKGTISITDLGIRKFKICTLCGHRELIIKNHG